MPSRKTENNPRSKSANTWHVIGFTAGLLILAVATWLALAQKLYGWEVRIFLEANNWSPDLQSIFKIISQLGLWIGVLLVVGGTFLKKWQFTWRLSASLLLGYGLVVVMKHLVARGRPEEYLQNVHVYWVEYGAGFPSAHAALATIAVLSLLPVLPKIWWWMFAPLFVGLVCLSRLYLGAHVPLDVIGGVALGGVVVCGLYLLPQPIAHILRLRNGTSKPT